VYLTSQLDPMPKGMPASCTAQHAKVGVRSKGREPKGRAGEGNEGEKGGLAPRGKMLTAR
jgi:hypothetical protein